jgi:hypothetical protein
MLKKEMEMEKNDSEIENRRGRSAGECTTDGNFRRFRNGSKYITLYYIYV